MATGSLTLLPKQLEKIIMPSEERTQAWIGDAVLALFARQWILANKEISENERAQAFTNLTANQFLASFGEPTAVEAEIGRIYTQDGLETAFDWIETKLVPLYQKQRRNQRRANGSYRKKSK